MPDCRLMSGEDVRDSIDVACGIWSSVVLRRAFETVLVPRRVMRLSAECLFDHYCRSGYCPKKSSVAAIFQLRDISLPLNGRVFGMLQLVDYPQRRLLQRLLFTLSR